MELKSLKIKNSYLEESLEKKKNETQFIKSQEPSAWDPYSNSHLGSELEPKSYGSYTHYEQFNPYKPLYIHYEQLNPATSYEKQILKECNLNEYFEIIDKSCEEDSFITSFSFYRPFICWFNFISFTYSNCFSFSTSFGDSFSTIFLTTFLFTVYTPYPISVLLRKNL